MDIRPAVYGDVESIMAVEKTGISHPWDKESIESVVSDDNKICIVAVDESLVGYIYASFVLDEAEIGNICIVPECRGQGVGRSLIDSMLSDLKSHGVCKVFLEVESDNASAIRLYERSGFVKYNQRRDYYGPGRDALLYSLTL